MEIKVLEMTDTRAKFVVRQSSPEFANALRRALIGEIPKMAIETVEFHLGRSWTRRERGVRERQPALRRDRLPPPRSGPDTIRPETFVKQGQVHLRWRGLPAMHHHVLPQQEGPVRRVLR